MDINQILKAVIELDASFEELGIKRDNSIIIEQTIGDYFIELRINTPHDNVDEDND